VTKITLEGIQGSHLAKTPFVASDSAHILDENLNGCALVAEGFHKEIPKGYICFAMAFSVGVESLIERSYVVSMVGTSRCDVRAACSGATPSNASAARLCVPPANTRPGTAQRAIPTIRAKHVRAITPPKA